MRLLRSRWIGVCLLAFATLSWTVTAQAQPQTKVVATFSILGDIVRAVGGDLVSVTILVGPEADAHVYQPTPSDARAIAEAKLVVVNGLGFEGWLNRLLRAAGGNAKVVVASVGVAPLVMEHHEEEEKPVARISRKVSKPSKVEDPHAWQDAKNAGLYALNIAAALAAADPANADRYRQAGEAFSAQAKALDAELRAMIGAVPANKRKVISSHDAFQYFSKAYGVEFLAVQGLSTESEPSAKDIARLIEQIRKDNIKALFVENISDRRLIDQIAREAGGVVGESLFSDALSKSGGPADSYMKMMRHNAAALLRGMERN